MEANEDYTITEAAALSGFSPNTLRAWVKAGTLKAEKVEGKYGAEYRIRAYDLYHSGIEKLNRRLGPGMVEVRKAEADASALASSEKYLEELVRLSGELVEARTELGVLRFQVPRLEAAQVERDKIREERDSIAQEKIALEVKVQVIEAALEQARVNAKWSWRRRMAKTGKA